MLPSIPVQKTQNKLATVSLILGLVAVLVATLLHFFLYLFPSALNDTLLNIFISTPLVIGSIGIIIGLVSLGQIMKNNIFGQAKAITGIVLGCVTLVGLIVFLYLLLARI